MFLINKLKDIFYYNEENKDLEKGKLKKQVHIGELNDEIWLYKEEYKKEHLSEEYITEEEYEGKDYDDDGNERKPKDHFLEVPLFDEDYNGRDINKKLMTKPIKIKEEEVMSEESISTTDDEEDIEEPFLDLYEELKREQSMKEFYNPMLKPRLWRLEFFIKYIHNLESQKQKNFYLVSFGNKKLKLYGSLKNEVLYTPGYTFEAGEVKYLRVPLPIWTEKEMSISYNDLENFELGIEMWQIKGLVFNELYACAKKTLKDIIEAEPDMNIILKRKIEKKNIIFETQRLGVYMQLSEIFEFHMALDSWWFISTAEMPTYLKKLPKFLRFKFPLSERDWIIHSSYNSSNNFWLYPGYFCFIGTYQQLANAFFILTVLCYNSNYRYKPPILLGSCIISLKSVTEYPFFKGIVKKLTLDKSRFKQGEIVGNIKCFINSYGMEENDINIQRPSQPLSDATLVNQLILNDHYLVIRVIKCENLAISSVDLNNVNINVWVKWDGMVNKTDTVTKTTSPFFYQNLYYPIRLVDKKELTNEHLIRNVLPIDLISKGDICFEVHNNNEIYSTILGIFELPFADIFNYGTEDFRSLAEENTKSTSQYNDYKDYNQFGSGRMDPSVDNYDDYYVKKYKTIVYKNTLELMYSKVHLKALNKENIHTKKESTISVEAFVIPPLPENLVFMKEEKVQNSSIIYKSMSKRWEKDFSKFNDTYNQWFPKAIKNRKFPCISRNDFDNNYYPLCSFVTSINLPAQVSTPGPLFHWLNNIEYIENEDESSIFTSPYFFLSYKKGTIQDHVLLLCCCLKGLEYDAYVCKGTINNGKKEHYWVMTRHEEGWVCFWEVTNKCIIHLKNRWNNNNFLKNSDIIMENEMLRKINMQTDNKYYSGEYLMNFVKYGLEELKKKEREIREEYDMKEENKLYSMDMYGEKKMKDEKVNVDEILYNDEEFFNNMFEIKYEKNDTYKCNKTLKYLLENFSKYIPISPKMFLLDYENTLTYVPYSSIEIVFNDQQLYGNMQNLHPSCILYDLENNYHWRPFLNHAPSQIKNEITISTPLSDKLSVKYTKDLEEEIREMILFMRNKEGLETNFNESSEIRYFLEMYIDLCEYKLNLDNNYNTKPENYEYSEEKKKKKKNEGENFETYETKGNIQEGNETNQMVGRVEGKNTWSQYKNDFYPNIEAQYVNKEDLNFYNSYHPVENIEMMNKEKKQHLTNIPNDYIYGMNDEIYNNGKEQYIKNYVFNKDNSANVLNNYDENVKRKNIKRFSMSAVHRKENIEHEKKKDVLEENKNNIFKGELNNLCSDTNRQKSNCDIYNEFCDDECCDDECCDDECCDDEYCDDECCDDEYCEEIYKEMKEKYYYDKDENIEEEEGYYKHMENIPNKFIKKYNKKHNYLWKLQKRLEKKSKRIKDELRGKKLWMNNNIGKVNKEMFANFIDTNNYLMKKLGANTNIKKTDNYSEYIKNIRNKEEHGYLFIPSKEIYKEMEERKKKKNSYNDDNNNNNNYCNVLYKNDLKNNNYHVMKNNLKLFSKRKFKKKIDRNILINLKCAYNLSRVKTKLSKYKFLSIKNKLRRTKEGHRYSTKRPIYLIPSNREIINEHITNNCDISNDEELVASRNKKKFVTQSEHQMYGDQNVFGMNYDQMGIDRNIVYNKNENDKQMQQHDQYIMNRNEQLATNMYDHVGEARNPQVENPSKTKEDFSYPPKTWSRLNPTSKYVAHQISQWNWYYSLEEQYFNWQYYKFPVPPNHTFVGFPIHFSTIDFTEVKSFLLHSKRFENIMKLSIYKISFVIYSKVYPLIGGVMSNWVFLGCLVPWMTAQERETKMKKTPKKNMDKR
ncbi:hypothetical protein PFHG_01205 [Plasmodium falciparum HB3]|uniref:C2 domain-containing protein n=1 Tax=Plasmodium falciparum (isolate HB3) TaxID=137071 RepID=A0A0L7K975_PLAFX|nr:hypothetical protein PFHG_01205 [Plasmodium falciparum HB3]